MWAGMLLWMLLFWVGILVPAFAVASWLFPTVPVAHPTAREIQDTRYARGELTQEEYRQMRRELTPDSPRGRQTVNSLIVVLILLVALILVAGLGMHGGWSDPGVSRATRRVAILDAPHVGTVTALRRALRWRKCQWTPSDGIR